MIRTERVDPLDLSPIPTWSEDFSAVRTHLVAAGAEGRPEEEVRALLSRNPGLVDECLGRVRIVGVNRACLELHRASSAGQLLEGLGNLLCEASREAVVAQLVAVACGQTMLDLDTTVRTLEGEERDVHLSWRVAPGAEVNLSQVIVCTEDITGRKRAEAALVARVRELTALTTIGRALSAGLCVEEVADRAVRALVETGHADAAFFFRVEGAGLRYLAGAPEAATTEHRGAAIRRGECVCGEAFADGKARFVADLADSTCCTRAECGAAGFRSFAALPIVVADRVEAVIGLAHRDKVDLSPQRSFFEALTGTISLSLQGALLIEQLRQDREVLERQVAARNRVEQQLREEAVLTDSIIRSLPAVFYLFDKDGQFLRWNAAFEEVTGRSAEELAKTHPLDLFTGPDRERVAARIAEVLAKGESSVEASLVAKDGLQRPHLLTGRRAVLRGVECVLGVGIDLSALAAAERSLRDLSLAIEASGDVVFVTDPRGVIESANALFTEIYGIPREEVVGRSTPRVLRSGRQDDTVYESFWATIRGGKRFRGEFVNRARDGREVIVDETVSPFFDERGEVRGYLAIQRDVTERRRLETDRARLSEQLRESQKLEALGRLAGGVAHDFNNLLTVIHCYAGMVGASLEEADPRRADLDDIVTASNRGTHLTAQLLAFSRRQVLEPRVVSLNAVVYALEGMVRRLVGERIQVSLDLRATPDSVLADESQLGQVLLNLAANARDAMRGGGRFEIATSNVVLAAPVVRLSVRDDGEGMDEETLAHVFEPFFTTKPRGSGTGLGLATVYGIVTQSGGSIGATSAKGRGTTFEIDLPQVGGAPDVRPAPPVVEAEGGGETILLVEDEDAVRMVTERLLRRAGYHVLSAADGAQALALVEHGGARPELVLTDVVMPRLDGLELSRRLASTHPDLPVVFMSGYADDVSGLEAAAAGADRFIGKPFTDVDLTRLLRRVLGARGARRP